MVSWSNIWVHVCYNLLQNSTSHVKRQILTVADARRLFLFSLLTYLLIF